MRNFFDTFLSIFFPFKCHVCSNDTKWGNVLCGSCSSILADKIDNPFLVSDVKTEIPVYTLSSYSQEISDVIKIIKYKPSRKLLVQLIEIIYHKNLDFKFAKPVDVFIPVPLHRERLKNRGFNQAEILAIAFADSSMSDSSNALLRTRNTKPQAHCDEKERLTNLNNAFSLNSTLIKEMFKNKHLCLVDDVATTGTTINLCANTLLELSPASVSALVLSHSFKRT